MNKSTLGGCKEVDPSTPMIQELAKYAVDEYNKQQGKQLKYERTTKAKQQVVAGMMYYLTLEAKDCDKCHIYEAKVWVQSWRHFKKLGEFKLIANAPTPVCN